MFCTGGHFNGEIWIVDAHFSTARKLLRENSNPKMSNVTPKFWSTKYEDHHKSKYPWLQDEWWMHHASLYYFYRNSFVYSPLAINSVDMAVLWWTCSSPASSYSLVEGHSFLLSRRPSSRGPPKPLLRNWFFTHNWTKISDERYALTQRNLNLLTKRRFLHWPRHVCIIPLAHHSIAFGTRIDLFGWSRTCSHFEVLVLVLRRRN